MKIIGHGNPDNNFESPCTIEALQKLNITEKQMLIPLSLIALRNYSYL
jgi:hypothetical protein